VIFLKINSLNLKKADMVILDTILEMPSA